VHHPIAAGELTQEPPPKRMPCQPEEPRRGQLAVGL
jgi:hypothetical protein